MFKGARKAPVASAPRARGIRADRVSFRSDLVDDERIKAVAVEGYAQNQVRSERSPSGGHWVIDYVLDFDPPR